MIRALIVFAVCLVALGTASTSTLDAQSIVHGVLQGRVTAESGTPLAEAEIIATNERTGLSRFGTSGRDGSYEISGLPVGEYSVRFEDLGYRPLIQRGVLVRSGMFVGLDVSLEPTAPPVESVDVRPGAAEGRELLLDGGSRSFRQDELHGTPEFVPGLAVVSELSSHRDSFGGAQGLPGGLSRTYVDGLLFTPALHPFRAGDPYALVGLPSRGLGQVTVLEVATDVEWSGSPGGYTSVQTLSAAGESRASFSGHLGDTGFWGSEAFDGTPPEATSWWGGGTANRTLGSDSSRVFLAVEALSVKTPRWVGLDSSFVRTVADQLSEPEEALDLRWNDELEAVSGLARFDWVLGSGAEVMVRTNFSRNRHTGNQFHGAPPAYGLEVDFRATDLSTAVSVNAPLGPRFLLEVRGGFERSDRAFGGEALDGRGRGEAALPPTFFVGERTLVGRAPGSDGRVLRTGFVGGPILHLDAGVHRFKAGVDLSIPSYEYTFAPPLEGFFFTDQDALVARRGAHAGIDGGDEKTSFTVPRLAGFVQYRWAPVRELDIITALRWDHEFLPSDRISFNEDWWDLTGLSNVNVPGSVGSWGGRLGISWDVAGRGSTFISGALGAHSGRIDPALLHEAILLDGPVVIRRALGALDGWPEDPTVPGTEPAVPVLALMNRDLRAPLTTRASLSLSRQVGAGARVRVSGTYRRTEYLARRTDLNRVSLPVANSNLERPLYGELAKEGSVLQAVSGSNRRFPGFDHVWALNSDGWSDYIGASIGLEYTWGVLDGFFDYTFSRTEDNWMGAAMGLPNAGLTPDLFPEGVAAGAVWEDGRSDFDLPHRMVAGAELAPWESVLLGATFRVQSGYPFTPSYPPGTDVNADGSGFNDPAFVPNVEAVEDLAQNWDCLRDWIGQVIERNACRAPTVYTLDAHLHLTLADWGSGRAQLLLEAFNLMDARTGPRDPALVIVDPDSGIMGQGTTSIEIPTVINPNFGKLLFPSGSGRRARIGFRLGAP